MIKWIFKKVWKNWLRDGYPGADGFGYKKVIKVTGWRSCIEESPLGNRHHTTFCPRWLPKWIEKI